MEKLSPSRKIHNNMHNKTSFTEFNYCHGAAIISKGVIS